MLACRQLWRLETLDLSNNSLLMPESTSGLSVVACYRSSQSSYIHVCVHVLWGPYGGRAS